MREVPVTVAKAQFSELLRDVERGESITITRNGKKVAALVPIEDYEKEQRRQAIERFKEARRGRRPVNISLEEILAWRHEGHRY